MGGNPAGRSARELDTNGQETPLGAFKCKWASIEGSLLGDRFMGAGHHSYNTFQIKFPY